MRAMVFGWLKQYWGFAAAGAVSVSCLVLAFGLGQAKPSAYLATAFCGLMAAYFAYGMIETLRQGNVGIDILAIMAIVSTLVVGEYWASLIIILMLTGGEALEDYAESRARGELTALLRHAPHIAHRVD